MKKEKLQNHSISVLSDYGIDSNNVLGGGLLKYSSGEYICFQGDSIEYVFIFLEGRAKVFYTIPNGKTLLMAYYTQKGIIGDAELMADMDTATSSVQAITDVECIGVPMRENKKYLLNNVKFVNVAGRELANKLHNNTMNGAYNILHPLDARLCAYIYNTHRDGYFKEKLTELSEVMGTSYRHLLRTLEKLCAEKVIEKSGRGYKILDEKLLEERVGDDY